MNEIMCDSSEIEGFIGGDVECLICGWEGLVSGINKPHPRGPGGRAPMMETAANLIREAIDAMIANPEIRKFWLNEKIISARVCEKWLRNNAHARHL